MIIEYFGLEGDADYDEMSERKREFWAQREGYSLIEFSPKDITNNGVEGFIELLLQRLREEGMSPARRTEEEIWQLTRKRAIGKFAEAMKGFVGRCRKLDLDTADLESMIAGHTAATTAEKLFLEVGAHVYGDYLQRLPRYGKEDFDGLMWRSVSLVRDGQTRFARDKGREHGDVARLRFVMIDEFQDFSQMFFEIVDAIRSINTAVQFFCVGDDWQAINGFAGSDPIFFENFNHYFQGTSPQYIRTNYRSATSVVETGNAVMQGRGLQARPERGDAGSVCLCDLEEFSPTATEQARHGGDYVTPAILRLTKYYLDHGLDVVMLSRKNRVSGYISYDETASAIVDDLQRFGEHIRSHLPEQERGRVSISTAHKYKGLEHAAVIVLDALEKSYPMIHPHWIFLRLLGDNMEKLESEERRLFYVATTRAEESLALVTESSRKSPYLDDIQQQFRSVWQSWEALRPAPSPDGRRLEVRVFNAYNVKNQLKDLGYGWCKSGKYWYNTMPEENFSFDALLDQPWVQDRLRIEVYSEAGEQLQLRESGGVGRDVVAESSSDRDAGD